MSRTILLADDSLTIQKVVELTFADTEYSVVALSSGEQLLQQLPTVHPDVIICDIIMPGKDGYEVCQEIKSDPDTLHIPVVLLSGTFEPFDRDRALAAGCSEIITKPFEARKLVETVDRLVSAPLEEAPVQPESAIEPPAAETLYTGRPTVAGPPEFPAEPMAVAAPVSQPGADESGLDFTDTGFADMEAAGMTVPDRPVELPTEGLDFEFSDQEEAFAAVAAEEQIEGLAEEPAPDEEEPVVDMPEDVSAATDPDLDLVARPPEPPSPPPEEPFPADASEGDDAGGPMFDRAGPFLADMDSSSPRFDGGPFDPADEEVDEEPAVVAEEAPASVSALPPVTEPPAPPLATWDGLGDVAEGEEEARAEQAPASLEVAPAAAHDHPDTAPVSLQPGAETESTPVASEHPPAPPEETTAPPAPVTSLSDEDVDRVARRLLELAADHIESVAWEVIPDMAEIVVRERIRQLEAEAERASSDSVQ